MPGGMHHAKAQSSQISVLRDGDQSKLYCCHSRRVNDMAGNAHVISVGVDLIPAMESHCGNAKVLVDGITEACLRKNGEAKIPEEAVDALRGVARVLNIAWIEDALLQPARIICPRSNNCPRSKPCESNRGSRAREITDVRAEILEKLARPK